MHSLCTVYAQFMYSLSVYSGGRSKISVRAFVVDICKFLILLGMRILSCFTENIPLMFIRMKDINEMKIIYMQSYLWEESTVVNEQKSTRVVVMEL